MTTWNIEETGYKPITTFWEDFSIADSFGEDAIKDTYERVMKEWSYDYKYLTELALVLNWKIWEHYEKNKELGKLYQYLWSKTDCYALHTLKHKELEYYYKVTD